MINRRTLLSTAAATGALSVGGVLTGLRKAAAQDYKAPLRRSLSDPKVGPDVEAYAEFVRITRDRPETEPVSWVSFSNIHGNLTTGFNLCPHSNWYFLPWHRAYVQMYEAAVRDVTGHTEFAMPYWDWTADPGFPAQFNDSASPLFLANRRMPSPSAAMPPRNTGKSLVMDPIYKETVYHVFGSSKPSGQMDTNPSWVKSRAGVQGPLENNPHNSVHGRISSPFMGSAASPQDPIFMMHHCNIDRVWAVWNSLGRQNSVDPLWTGMTFVENFIAPDGSKYSKTVNELYDVVALGYTYGLTASAAPSVSDPAAELLLSAVFENPVQTAMMTATVRSVAMAEQVATPGQALSLTISTAGRNLPGLVNTGAMESMLAVGLKPKSAYAIIRGLQAENEQTELLIFVNQPDANASTATDGNPNFVTSISFFGQNAHSNGETSHSSIIDMTDALAALNAQGMLTDDAITVQLVPVGQGAEADPGNVSVSEVELVVA